MQCLEGRSKHITFLQKPCVWKPDVLVNTENRKTFEGNSRARKGKITAEDDNWRDQKEQGSLTS